MIEINSLNDLIVYGKQKNKSIFEIALENDMDERQVTRDDAFAAMKEMYLAMKQADSSYDGTLHSKSNMAGGSGQLLEDYFNSNSGIVGDFISEVMKKAIKMGESNACMKRIVAAPTAGSCGVIPAVFIAYEDYRKESIERMTEALFVSGEIGYILAKNASISGAEGGCQAEIGSASAMAAAGLAYLEDGDSTTCIHAAALALKGLMGLVCDPVAGLVEVPCIKRNVTGAVNAVSSAQMALAGIQSIIPPDEVVDAMRRVGNLLPASLKETSQEGLATTPTALTIAHDLIQ